jgi:hypothetical protein
VLAHARALLTSDPRAATAYLDAHLRNTRQIMDQARQTLDFSQPIAVMLLGSCRSSPTPTSPTRSPRS